MDDMERTALVVKLNSKLQWSCLCDYSDAFILAKGTITVAITGTAVAPNNRNKKVILKIVLYLLIA